MNIHKNARLIRLGRERMMEQIAWQPESGGRSVQIRIGRKSLVKRQPPTQNRVFGRNSGIQHEYCK